jgi:5-methylcytosine-specific restriction endonuclease McrA
MAQDRLSRSTLKRFAKYNTKHIDHSVTLFQLYIKHKGQCQQCPTKTIFGQHPTVDDSATMEHITPLSQGGNHTWDNVTLLCQKCNFDNNEKKMYALKNKVEKHEYIVPVKMFSLLGYSFYYKKGKQ